MSGLIAARAPVLVSALGAAVLLFGAACERLANAKLIVGILSLLHAQKMNMEDLQQMNRLRAAHADLNPGVV